LYLKGQQGIGKSTLFVFLKDYVIGLELLLETGSEPIRSKFNSILAGKLLVVFEELENFSCNEWNAISSKLKHLVDSTTFTIEKKGIDSIQTNNLNNYIINSNNDAIKDDDGRRYFILDVSHKYMGNHEYFGQLRKKAFHDKVGQAFYSFMLEIDVNNFIPQNYPDTESKLNSHIKRLDKVYEFIKEEFILKKINIKHTTKELYDMYKEFTQSNNYKKVDKTTFKEKLTQINITYKKTNGNDYYKYSIDTLIDIYKKRHWISDDDEFEDENISIESDKDNIEQQEIKEKDDLLKEKDDLLNLLKEKDEEIEKLKEALLKLELIELMKKSKVNDNQKRAITFRNNKIEDPKEEDDLAL
jgi:hypothetical protein